MRYNVKIAERLDCIGSAVLAEAGLMDADIPVISVDNITEDSLIHLIELAKSGVISLAFELEV